MNILIVGLGSIAKKHIAALRELKIDFKIYALRSNINKEIEEELYTKLTQANKKLKKITLN